MPSQPPQFPFNDLPLELQREILLASALEEMSNATRIVRVSKLAYNWISPVIYNMVTLGYDDTALFIRTLASKPAEFFATHVKCLCLSVSVEPVHAEKILFTCTGVEMLAFWVDYLSAFPNSSISHLISPLPLRRLSIEAQHLHAICQSPSNPTRDFDSIWYTHLTQLDIVFWPEDDSYTIPCLSHFPCLTHVGLWHPHALVDENVVLFVLDSCKRLEILLIVVDESDLAQIHLTFQDPRVVLMPYPSTVIQDWEASFIGKPSTWARAKEARRANAKLKHTSDGSSGEGAS